MINPIANCFSGLWAFLIQLIFFAGYYVTFKFFVQSPEPYGCTWALILVPLLVLISGMCGLGLGLWMSVLTAKYRDLSKLSSFLIQALMYGTPIIYPIDAMPTKFQSLALLNPMAPVVESFRFALLGKGHFSPTELAYSFLFASSIFLSGIVLFNKTEKMVVDYV